MIGLNTAAVYVLQTLGSLYLLIVLMRFVPVSYTHLTLPTICSV